MFSMYDSTYSLLYIIIMNIKKAKLKNKNINKYYPTVVDHILIYIICIHNTYLPYYLLTIHTLIIINYAHDI